jgi:hypothetical protein
VSSAIFDDLADFNAILGSRCWLGFTASGLSPDKKRLALLGAQWQGSHTPDLRASVDFGLIVELF